MTYSRPQLAKQKRSVKQLISKARKMMRRLKVDEAEIVKFAKIPPCNWPPAFAAKMKPLFKAVDYNFARALDVITYRHANAIGLCNNLARFEHRKRKRFNELKKYGRAKDGQPAFISDHEHKLYIGERFGASTGVPRLVFRHVIRGMGVEENLEQAGWWLGMIYTLFQDDRELKNYRKYILDPLRCLAEFIGELKLYLGTLDYEAEVDKALTDQSAVEKKPPSKGSSKGRKPTVGRGTSQRKKPRKLLHTKLRPGCVQRVVRAVEEGKPVTARKMKTQYGRKLTQIKDDVRRWKDQELATEVLKKLDTIRPG